MQRLEPFAKLILSSVLLFHRKYSAGIGNHPPKHYFCFFNNQTNFVSDKENLKMRIELFQCGLLESLRIGIE